MLGASSRVRELRHMLGELNHMLVHFCVVSACLSEVTLAKALTPFT